ncbi:MAG: PstS family phosphate ABC transporter substrate-binding protein [Desulfofustis sp. PB-SRB1]|jgi:phosphate transport system substrate-binding protein|nr:PstS family phosphate ABC transporter substrate-binding protein [Desulfofustis sp. PB-SRB1]MBM1002291.1 PstS family phosphate ABC transporter substrate-binding protein [Desulfofustis sp. PB-SRB1]HBH28097.1 phosphate ABC transporter substrate-binding protein [Desulfofustis sp.]HBH31072.1 phosphate ABC transporter substrate-binding protein [Desulfofustis sp.]
MKVKGLLVAGALFAATVVGANAHAARDYIAIVGSSTVYPFATVVAEQFGKTTDFKTPKIESTGSGGGLKLFCAGLGPDHPDITNASRAIKASEQKTCAENGITEIVEVKVGYDGIVLANSKQAGQLDLSRKDVFLALAKHVPMDGKLVENPYKTWADINPDLPAVAIEVLGPPPTSGTRDAFVELVMEEGVEEVDMTGISEDAMKEFEPGALREDGAYVEAGENDNLIVQKLQANPAAIGIFGFSFLDQNADVIQGSMIEGQAPTFENIADGKYPVSRSLFFYVKKAHVGTIPGIEEYLAEFSSENAWGPEGYLADRGLIPMPDGERAQFAADVANLTPMAMK